MPEHIWKEHRHGVRCEKCGLVTQEAHQLWPCMGPEVEPASSTLVTIPELTKDYARIIDQVAGCLGCAPPDVVRIAAALAESVKLLTSRINADELVAFFRKEAVEEGKLGDEKQWSTARCAIETIRDLKHQLFAARRERQSEKDRRVYYQDLVYEVCRLIDVANGNMPGTGIVCGTVDEPSTQLQQAVTVLIQKALNGTSSEAMNILSHVSRTLRLAIPDQSQTCLEALAAMVVKQRDDAMEELKALRAIVEPLNRLRSEEGESVEILCDNPEGPPNCAIRVFSDWGGVHWEQRRFDGNTLAECLKAAEEAKAASERQAAQ